MKQILGAESYGGRVQSAGDGVEIVSHQRTKGTGQHCKKCRDDRLVDLFAFTALQTPDLTLTFKPIFEVAGKTRLDRVQIRDADRLSLGSTLPQILDQQFQDQRFALAKRVNPGAEFGGNIRPVEAG
jgi:hypothetical protein